MGGDPLGLGKLKLAPGPGGVPDVSLEEVMQMQAALISQLRGEVETLRISIETISLAAAALLWYIDQGHAPPRTRDARYAVPQELVEQVRGSVVTVGSTADGDMLLRRTPGNSLPVWETG